MGRHPNRTVSRILRGTDLSRVHDDGIEKSGASGLASDGALNTFVRSLSWNSPSPVLGRRFYHWDDLGCNLSKILDTLDYNIYSCVLGCNGDADSMGGW